MYFRRLIVVQNKGPHLLVVVTVNATVADVLKWKFVWPTILMRSALPKKL